jgi:hypothetical protein
MHLAGCTKDVQSVVRRKRLGDTMAHYIIDQIGRTANVWLQTRSNTSPHAVSSRCCSTIE